MQVVKYVINTKMVFQSKQIVKLKKHIFLITLQKIFSNYHQIEFNKLSFQKNFFFQIKLLLINILQFYWSLMQWLFLLCIDN